MRDFGFFYKKLKMPIQKCAEWTQSYMNLNCKKLVDEKIPIKLLSYLNFGWSSHLETYKIQTKISKISSMTEVWEYMFLQNQSFVI